jgi:hypothetical protein
MTVRTGLGLSCVALLTVAACAPPPPSPDGGGSDVTMPDASGDGGSMTDGPVGDAGPLCNRVAIENLEALGTRMGSTLRYAGDNNSASEVPTAGAQSSAAIQGLSGCQFRMAYQRVFAYTATQDAALRISTSNMGTSTSFDTALLVYNAPCPTTAANQGRAFLGCNDDDLRFDGDDRRTTSNVVTVRKVARGATVYISLGGFVPVSGTRNMPGERGAFELTVDELPVVANGMACDARRLTNACDDTSTCVGSSFTSLTGTCRANGSVAGSVCAEGGMCMGAGLQCNAETNICEATNVPDGMPCNPFAQCGANSTCVGLQRGLTSGTCRALGSVVGAGCAMGNTCAMGLTCVTPPGATEGICLNAAPMGGMCNTFDSVCPTGQDCLGSTVFGTAGTCTGLGTAAGADCNSGMCTAPLACTMRETTSICTNARMTGQSCGVFDECAMGGTCYLNEPNNRTAGTCFAAGVRGGPCRTSGTACDAGSTCSDTATPANGRCVATAMMGGMCDLATECPENSMCVRTSATGMPYAGTCRAFGAEGARCRFTGERCDAGLTCSSSFTADGICQRPAMGTCDPRLATNRCAAGQVCRATSLDTGMCAAPTMEMGDNDAVSATLPVTTAPAAILGSLTFADVDCFAFEATGQALFAKVNNPSGLCSAELALDLYRLDGTNVRLLGGDTNAGAYGCPRIDGGETNYSFAAGLMGRHYLCVRNAADNRAPVSQYALSIALR